MKKRLIHKLGDLQNKTLSLRLKFEGDIDYFDDFTDVSLCSEGLPFYCFRTRSISYNFENAYYYSQEKYEVGERIPSNFPELASVLNIYHLTEETKALFDGSVFTPKYIFWKDGTTNRYILSFKGVTVKTIEDGSNTIMEVTLKNSLKV